MIVFYSTYSTFSDHAVERDYCVKLTNLFTKVVKIQKSLTKIKLNLFFCEFNQFHSLTFTLFALYVYLFARHNTCLFTEYLVFSKQGM